MFGTNLKRLIFSIFNKLVYGELPTANEILGTLNKIAERMTQIDWKME